LAPIDNDLQEYLSFKFKRVGADVSSILDESVIPALIENLTQKNKGIDAYSTVHPLAINSLLANAMNTAMALGENMVSADLIKEL